DKVEDINLDLEDFMQKVNSDLVGKVVNIASRSAGFLVKKYDGMLSEVCVESELLEDITKTGDEIAAAYENREFSRAMRLIMQCADKANEYIDAKKPWSLAKLEGTEQEVQDVCSVAINIFRQLMVYLAPVLPELTNNAKEFLNLKDLSFASRNEWLLGHKINKFKPLMQRIEEKDIEAMVEDSKASLTQADAPAATESSKPAAKEKAPVTNADAEQTDYIGIEDFAKVEMKVAHVLECNHVEGADKLLQFTLDVGEDKPRNVFSGIRKFYEPEQLINKKVICVTNLAPRKMKFGVSEGMVLSTGEPKTGLTVVTLPDACVVGDVLA
ncbi:MAG: methionine--tRNA ligase subunit beta, partial [Psychrobacter nivimaris]